MTRGLTQHTSNYDGPTQLHGISAVIVAHNEEAVIARCLKSLAGVVDEIVLVHDGPCSDQTLAVAREFGARIFVRPFTGSAEAHRVFTYEQARYSWIFQIDADEYLSDGLRAELRSLIQDPAIDAYTFRWPTTDGKRVLAGYADTTKKMLLRRAKMYYLGITHEAPQTYGTTAKRLDLVLEHWPPRNDYTWGRFVHKHLAKNALQAWQIFKLDEAPVFNIDPSTWETNPLICYYHQQLHHPYWFAIKRYVLADIAKTFLRRNLWHVLITNGHVSLMFWLGSLYVAYRLSCYKHELTGQIVADMNAGISAR